MSKTERLERAWENQRGSFYELPKAEFDAHVRAGRFATGPLAASPSAWMDEYGPYNPERWAFGELQNGQRVCAKISP